MMMSLPYENLIGYVNILISNRVEHTSASTTNSEGHGQMKLTWLKSDWTPPKKIDHQKLQRNE